MISIILISEKETDVAAALDRLAGQAGDCEIIVVDGGETTGAARDAANHRARVVSAPAPSPGARFNAGAAVAAGEILLFLDPHSRLPADALPAIERDFRLLPRTIGGNFHLKFERESLWAKTIGHGLKWWRYRGSYGDNSGIFVRKGVFEKLGGFQADRTLAGYDFAHRLEKLGPTLYLPEAIVAPIPDFWDALVWLVAPVFMKR